MADDPGPQDGFTVPEPPTGLGPGFLSEYWKSRGPLPLMGTGELVMYYLQRGVQNVFSLPMSSGITVMTTGLALFLLAGFLLLLQNVQTILEDSGTNFQVTAYFSDFAKEGEVLSFMESLEKDTRIRSAKYVSSSEALKEFKESLGTKDSLLEGLAGENPLPASVDLIVQPDELGIQSVENVVTSLRGSPIIEDLVYGNEWVDRTKGVVSVFRLFGFSALLIALATIIFLISNTIKLVIYSRRQEIAIMQLVGASDAFVRVPFVLGGLLQGLVGSVFGLGFLKLGFLMLNSQIGNSTVLGVAIPELYFLTVPSVCAILSIGAVIGAAGSFFALGRFMNV